MRATAQGTAAFAVRFPAKRAPGHFRSALGLTLSSLGLGTYRGRADEEADHGYRQAIVAAVQGGINVIDTAVNYRFQHSERVVGQALRELPREEIVVATKGGYVPARDPEDYFAEHVVKAGLARQEDLVAGCHCLAPGFLRHQLETSLGNLGLQALDIYYLHNPEQQLGEVPRELFSGRMRAAFEVLEEAVTRGSIGAYGTATWNGYRVPGGLSLESLVGLAREVAGEGHHFRVIQLPLNLALREALTKPTQTLAGKGLTPLAAASSLGITVMTSASIGQGRLGGDLREALEFALSAPGVTTALVGMGRAEHVAENLRILQSYN